MKRIVSLMAFLIPFILMAQDEVQGLWRVEEKPLYIGERFFVELEVKASSDIKIELPEQLASINVLEPVGSKLEDNIDALDEVIYKKKFNFIAFDSVVAQIPSIQIPYEKDGKGRELIIEGISVSVSRMPVDSTDALRAAYGPMAPEEQLNWNLFFIMVGVLIAMAAITAFVRWKKDNNRLSIPMGADPKEWALQQLEIIASQIPFDNQKSSWTHLTEVVRLYMERKWNIPAPYFSTGEALSAIANKQEYVSMLNTVADVLELGDQVKFAKKITSEDIQRVSLQKAKDIIHYEYLAPLSIVKEEVLDE